MLVNQHPIEPLSRGGGEELVRLVLRLYTDPTADVVAKGRSMDAFDKLMERYAYEAQRALWTSGTEGDGESPPLPSS
jgi:hypothetical protein